MFRFIITVLLFTSLINSAKAQIVINEASNRNYKQVADEDGEYNDWIELYNAGNDDVDLNGWSLSDSRKNPGKSKFGQVVITARNFLLAQASGKDRMEILKTTHWESAVLPENDFSYLVPNSSTPVDWFQPAFNDSLWEIGKAGFGFGDNDDRTEVPQQTITVYLRKRFIVPDSSAILAGVLHVDYDDGFIAYLNGVEIARSNMKNIPEWNSLSATGHEAVIYTGGEPERFDIDSVKLKNLLRTGENVLCLEVHNQNGTSTDLSLIPFLSFAFEKDTTFFQPTPLWFHVPPSEYLHTNFKISNDGEMIFLSDTNSFVDSMKVESTQLDQSTGRITDGSAQFGIFINATPGASNNSSQSFTSGFTLKPEFNHQAGFYNSTVELIITNKEENTLIRYTTDGSEPTITSTLYSAPIKISSTKCIKARCFSPGKLPGEVTTATFFISKEYTIPVLSVTTNNSNLYGSQGIFDNSNESWNVPSYVEYFEKDKVLAFHQFAGMQIDGGAGGSRSGPQNSFRIEPGNSTLGDGDLNYKLMPRRPNRTKFPSFYVRNGSNQRMVLPYKDALQVTALGRNTYTYYSAYHPIVVYINGKYFGVYELREKINDDYLEDNYHMDIDSLDFLGVSYFKGTQNGEGLKLEALRGSVDPFNSDYDRFMKMNPQSPDYLEQVDEFLDLKCYTDYIIAESWVADIDWPYNNIKVFRCKSTGYRWHWAICDLELSLDPGGWNTSTFDHIQYMMGYSSMYTDFWNKLRLNAKYKAYFVNRFADLMNTSYNFTSTGKLESEMFNEIYPEMGGEYKQWGNSNINAQLTAFSNNHETFRSELEKRSGVVRANLQSHFNLSRQVKVTLEVEPEGSGSIQISTINPAIYPWEGIYFTNVPVEVTALPNLGYRFSNWDANSFISDINQATVSKAFNETKITLKAHFEKTDDSYDGLVVSEINFKTGPDIYSPDWLEFCNLGQDEINLKGWYFTDIDSTHLFIFNEDITLSHNQRLVVSNNRQQFKALYPNVSVYSQEFLFGFGSPTDEIHLYNAERKVVLSFSYSDIYPWALSENSEGRTLELRLPSGDLSSPTSWFRGCIGGSPGEAYQPCNEPVVSAPLVSAISDFDVKVFPNPVNDFIELEILLDEDVAFCDAKIYNLTGSVLKLVSLGSLRSGYFETRVELNGIEESMLILQVSTDRNVKTVKVVRVR
jgi:hypothetical protein